MELFGNLNSTERITWRAWGLVSFIMLIAYLRWVGPREEQKKARPPKVPNRQAEND